MALSFLKDRDENAVLGNLGAFSGGGARGQSVQTALEIYRKDQKSHHEQSIASDLTRGLLRKVFRDTVLESSKQVKRKYSYSAVGSTVQEDIDATNMGIMAKLKKLQKERLIVARLGFPDKAMEIDKHIEKIRADLRSEREKVDSRILKEALSELALRHRAKLSALEMELREDENKVRGAFERERAALLAKQEKQFVQLVDDAIKRAIGKSKSCSCAKKYLCHHNKTASFNTRRPKKEVIHFRKNAKRLRHGGRLEESAAWEEKAAELDAEHLDKWREEVAASLTASAWGGSSSALDQLASQHQREVSRMETAQANEWTLMLMRHRTARRNCQNAIMVEQKKLRVACKKSAEERHRREMLGEADPIEGGAGVSGGPDEEVAGMLSSAIDDGDFTVEDKEQGQAQEISATNGVATARPPTRPSSAPPARGRRPQLNTGNNESNPHTSAPSVAVSAGAGAVATDGEEGESVDGDSFGKDSHDLAGFDELEGEAAEAFSYDDYPAAGSPEEPEMFHTPWCGSNSGDIPVLDKVFEKAPVGGGDAPTLKQRALQMPMSAPPAHSSTGVSDKSPSGEYTSSFVEHSDVGGSSTKIEENTKAYPPRRERGHTDGRERGHPDGGGVEPGVTIELSPIVRSTGEEGVVAAMSPLSLAGGVEGGAGRGSGRRSPRPASGGVSSPRVIAGGGELKRYDWGGADVVPTKPSLVAASKVPTGNRADKQRFRNARRKEANKKTVSWGENVEVPPESDDDEGDTDDGEGGDGEGSDRSDTDASNLDAVADGFVDDDFLKDDDDDDDGWRSKEKRTTSHTTKLSTLDPLEESAVATKWTAARASDASEKMRVSAPITTSRKSREGLKAEDAAWVLHSEVNREVNRQGGDVSEGVRSEDNKEGVTSTNGDGRPEEREAFDVDTVSARAKKRRAPSVEAGPSAATQEGISHRERSEPDQNCTEEHPLQHALDQFCLILALHGDWLSLLGQIVGDEVCRRALHRWSGGHYWREHVGACFTADLAKSADGSVSSWGSVSARAAAETVACSAILARFIASPAAWRMVHGSKAGRKAMGGRTIAEEPALARSRRPWRTLFERVLGSLPYGAILSLTEASGNVSIGCGERESFKRDGSVARAGKVLWVNEGFEQLAGVDAVDMVGQEVCRLFEEDEGEDGEGREGGERGKLKRSLELGKNCMLWMTMAERQDDGVTDVLCLHQTVEVSPRISGEGRYAVLMFFDTASVLFESQQQVGPGPGGRDKGEDEGLVTQPDREERAVLDQEREDKRRESGRRQACHDISKAMAMLLSGGDVDMESDLPEAAGDGPFIDSRESESPTSSGRDSSRNSTVVDETKGVEENRAGRKARDIDYGPEVEGDPEQRPSTLERPSLLGLSRESNGLLSEVQRDELDGELLEGRLARECGIVHEPRSDSVEGLPLSDIPRTHGGGGQGEEVDVEVGQHAFSRDKEQHKQHVPPTFAPHSAVEHDAAEYQYSSGDESSAPPRVDLLLSPSRASTPTRSTLSTGAQQAAGETIRSPRRDSCNGGTTIVEKTLLTPATNSEVLGSGRRREEAETDTTMGELGSNHQDTLPGTVDRGDERIAAIAKYDDASPSSTARNLRLSLDGYEDDFCDDEDESTSLAHPEAEGKGSAGKSFDATTDKITTSTTNNNKFEAMENRIETFRGGNGGTVPGGFDEGGDAENAADGCASSTSEGVYSSTAAGGLEADIRGGGRYDGRDDTWGGSPEADDGDLWGIRSPPRPRAGNHQNLSSRNSGSRM